MEVIYTHSWDILEFLLVLITVMIDFIGKKNISFGIFIWRFVTLVAIFILIFSLYFERYTFTFFLIIECFVIIPLTNQISTCNNCGKRDYFRKLFSNKCKYCNNIFSKK